MHRPPARKRDAPQGRGISGATKKSTHLHPIPSNPANQARPFQVLTLKSNGRWTAYMSYATSGEAAHVARLLRWVGAAAKIVGPNGELELEATP